MTDREFHAAYTAAPRYPDADAYADAYGEEARPLWGVACLPFREFLALTGYSRAGLARRYCIPLRTVEDWLAGKNQAPSLWVRLLIAEATGVIKREDFEA